MDKIELNPDSGYPAHFLPVQKTGEANPTTLWVEPGKKYPVGPDDEPGEHIGETLAASLVERGLFVWSKGRKPVHADATAHVESSEKAAKGKKADEKNDETPAAG